MEQIPQIHRQYIQGDQKDIESRTGNIETRYKIDNRQQSSASENEDIKF